MVSSFVYMKAFSSISQYISKYAKPNKTLFIGLFLILVFLGYGVYWSYKSRFTHCVLFFATHSAEDAFICGNHHFGVYGPSGYSIEKAEQYFGKAVEIDPKTPDAWHQYARIAFLRGNFETALYRINRQFAERGDELMAAYYIRGLIYGYKKDYPNAQKDFEKYVAWNPTNWAANNDLAWIYFVQGKFADSKRQTESGMKYFPDNPWLLVSHAMSIYNLGDSVGAEAELLRAREAAAKLAPRDWDKAYPGNDPAIAEQGLAEFKRTIEKNIELVHSKTKAP